MPKTIIGETFEQLGKTAGQVVKQVVKEPGRMAEKAVRQIGLKPYPPKEKPQEALSTKVSQEKERERRRKLALLQAEIKALQQRKQELPKQITGKPGFSEEEAIKQLKEKKEKPMEPLPIRRAKRKTEVFRGVSG
jgi:hypothetical protein